MYEKCWTRCLNIWKYSFLCKLLGAYFKPGTMLAALHSLTHSMLKVNSEGTGKLSKLPICTVRTSRVESESLPSDFHTHALDHHTPFHTQSTTCPYPVGQKQHQGPRRPHEEDPSNSVSWWPPSPPVRRGTEDTAQDNELYQEAWRPLLTSGVLNLSKYSSPPYPRFCFQWFQLSVANCCPKM